MQDKVRTFTEPEELLEYLLINGCEIDLSKEDVEVLLGYETGRGYCLGEMAGKLCRVDVCMQPEVVEETTIDDVINEVTEWNYEMIQEADKDRHEPDDFVDFCNKQARYDSLAEDEKRIDAMFGQTSYQKEIDRMAERIAAKLIKKYALEELERTAAESPLESVPEPDGRSR